MKIVISGRIAGYIVMTFVAYLMAVPPAQADLRTWLPNGADPYWNTSTNWTGGAVPVSADDVQVYSATPNSCIITGTAPQSAHGIEVGGSSSDPGRLIVDTNVSLTVSPGFLNVGYGIPACWGSMEIRPGAKVTCGTYFVLGPAGSSTAYGDSFLTVTGGTLTAASDVYVGWVTGTATSTLYVADGGAVTGNPVVVGAAWMDRDAHGRIYLNGTNSRIYSTITLRNGPGSSAAPFTGQGDGEIYIEGGTLVAAANFYNADASSATSGVTRGIVTVSSGLCDVAGLINNGLPAAAGAYAQLTVTGGVLRMGGDLYNSYAQSTGSGTGVVEVTGGALDVLGAIYNGLPVAAGGAYGQLTVTGGVMRVGGNLYNSFPESTGDAIGVVEVAGGALSITGQLYNANAGVSAGGRSDGRVTISGGSFDVYSASHNGIAGPASAYASLTVTGGTAHLRGYLYNAAISSPGSITGIIEVAAGQLTVDSSIRNGQMTADTASGSADARIIVSGGDLVCNVPDDYFYNGFKQEAGTGSMNALFRITGGTFAFTNSPYDFINSYEDGGFGNMTGTVEIAGGTFSNRHNFLNAWAAASADTHATLTVSGGRIDIGGNLDNGYSGGTGVPYGTIKVSGGAGTFNVGGSLTMSAQSVLIADIQGLAHTPIRVGGGATLQGTLKVTGNYNGGPASWDLIVASSLSGTLTLDTSAVRGHWTVEYTPAKVILHYTPAGTTFFFR